MKADKADGPALRSPAVPDVPDLQRDIAPAFAALDVCDRDLERLDGMCCDPGRSPQMRDLAAALAAIRGSVSEVASAGAGAGDTIAHVEEAGAMLGRLQVTCCAPPRMALYAQMLENLTKLQSTVARATGTGH